MLGLSLSRNPCKTATFLRLPRARSGCWDFYTAGFGPTDPAIAGEQVAVYAATPARGRVVGKASSGGHLRASVRRVTDTHDTHDEPEATDAEAGAIKEPQRSNPADAAGTLTGVFPPGHLEELRDEWDRRAERIFDLTDPEVLETVRETAGGE